MNDAEKQARLLRMMEEEQKQNSASSPMPETPFQNQPSPLKSSSNLINCSDCGREVSTRARECPNCGCPLDIKYQKAEMERSLNQEKNELIDEGNELEENINFLRKETDSAVNTKFGFGCLVYFLVIISFAVWFNNMLPNDSSSGWGGALMGFIICINLSVFGFFKLFVSKEKRAQIDQLKVFESRLEANKKETQKLTSNIEKFNSTKAFASLGAAYGIHQLREARQELSDINEKLSEGGGDASGGDGGGGGDFGGF